MATMFSSALVPDSTVAAHIQGWASWLESVLTTIAGWTVTSDTGQTLPSSLQGGTAQFQKLGYRIYQMNDEFSAVNPIYMRVDFGTSQYSTPPSNIGASPGMWFSFGSGTDGAGNLTGLLWDGKGWNPNGPTIQTNNHPSQPPINYTTRNYASADNSRFVIGMFVSDIQNPAGYYGSDQICFSLERSRDKDGNYTGDGLMITYTDQQLIGGGGTTESLSATKYLICNQGGHAQPPLEKGLSYPYIKHSPAYSYDGTVPCAMCSHFRGIAQQPGINFILLGVNDIGLESQYQVTIYGVNHIYQNLRYLCSAIATSGSLSGTSALNDGGCRVSILYE